MTGPGARDEGAISDVPWALMFDPAVNVRALGEIQARGFRAAADLVDRFVNRADQDPGAVNEADGAGPANGERNGANRRPDVEQLLDSWKGLIGQVADSLRGAGSPQRPGDAAFDVAASTVRGQLDVRASEPGVVSAEVWLHNRGPTDRGTIALRCGDLLSHDGSLISAARVRFDPEVVPMPARCSRGVAVNITVGDDVAPGRYHGTLLIDGYPDAWLPVLLTVGHGNP
ncbi:hypothetical protein [Mycobacterium palustre]|uniref:Uncharacterized protein n=1 Tax=Mycobacterium palustre TaxID=153971 RepID=A0A1X1Z3M9_9MYCO|nr:hypothetical protein [Mycobacterium palustre]MCV7101105.1 hypothetical protein [Mycobacterium palustre]ORW17942.1 hypothetical protein AWC19_19905 [Mycobacterium palustre]